MDMRTLTVKDRPKHHAIGRFFFCNWNSQVYYCDSYDPQNDFWMQNVVDPTDRKPVVGRAIGYNSTYAPVEDTWKPQRGDELVGRVYWAVDTHMPLELLISRQVTEAEAMDLDERVSLFFWQGDDIRFIEMIRNAASRLKEETVATVASYA